MRQPKAVLRLPRAFAREYAPVEETSLSGNSHDQNTIYYAIRVPSAGGGLTISRPTCTAGVGLAIPTRASKDYCIIFPISTLDQRPSFFRTTTNYGRLRIHKAPRREGRSSQHLPVPATGLALRSIATRARLASVWGSAAAAQRQRGQDRVREVSCLSCRHRGVVYRTRPLVR